jgi:hypothetical protein
MFHSATVVVHTKVQIMLKSKKTINTVKTKKKVAYQEYKLQLTILCAHFSTTMMINL